MKVYTTKDIGVDQYDIPGILETLANEEQAAYVDTFTVLHDKGELTEQLTAYDFVAFRQHGSPFISLNVFAGNKAAFEKLAKESKEYKGDNTLPIEANWNNMVLNTIGDKCLVIPDNNLFVKTLKADCKGKGQIATNVMGNELMQIISEAKLNAYDIAENLLANLKEDYREPIYED